MNILQALVPVQWYARTILLLGIRTFFTFIPTSSPSRFSPPLPFIWSVPHCSHPGDNISHFDRAVRGASLSHSAHFWESDLISSKSESLFLKCHLKRECEKESYPVSVFENDFLAVFTVFPVRQLLSVWQATFTGNNLHYCYWLKNQNSHAINNT